MINQINNLEKIKQETKEFFKKMGFETEIEVEKQENIIFIKIKTTEPKILIGNQGKTLLSIQGLLRKIFQKQLEQKIFIDLDIDDYKKRKIEFLKEKARLIADEVFLLKKQKILEPMPAHERRIIHLELSSYQGVVTKSFGQEPNRMVIIQPE